MPGLMEFPNGKPPKRPHMSSGYAAIPGTGPAGETCGSCRHHKVVEYANRYHKCAIGKVTSGAATDIRVRSAACIKWEKIG